MRFESSPELFGGGCGSGTIGRFHCDRCGRDFNEENERPDGSIVDENIDSTRFTEFAGMMICEDCFEGIEDEILSRLDDILRWVGKILAARRVELNDSEELYREALCHLALSSKAGKETNGKDEGRTEPRQS